MALGVRLRVSSPDVVAVVLWLRLAVCEVVREAESVGRGVRLCVGLGVDEGDLVAQGDRVRVAVAVRVVNEGLRERLAVGEKLREGGTVGL